MPTAEAVATAAGRTDVLGQQLAQIVSNDLRTSGLFKPLEAGLKPVAYAEVTAPTSIIGARQGLPRWCRALFARMAMAR